MTTPTTFTALPSVAGVVSAPATASTSFGFGGFGNAYSTPSTTRTNTPDTAGPKGASISTADQVSFIPLAHTHQSLSALSVATQPNVFTTSQSTLTFSVLVRTSNAAQNWLDALIVVQSALGRPISARFAVTFVVEKAPTSTPAPAFGGARSTTPASLTVGPSPWSSLFMPPVVAPSVIQVACDCSSLHGVNSAPPIRITSIKVSIQHSIVSDTPLAVPALSTSQLALLSTLDDPHVSDCALLPKDASVSIRVSRAILTQSSSFFKSMFQGPWMENSQSDKPIEFGWSSVVVVICLIHVYSAGQWFPNQAVPKAKSLTALLTKMQVPVPLVESMTRHQWTELMDLAVMLELFPLAKVANRQLSKLLDAEQTKWDQEAKALEQKMRALLLEE